MTDKFWENDETVSSGQASSATNFWEGDEDAAKADLPKGVKPSTAGGGRGSVNPPRIAAQMSDEELNKPAGVMAQTIAKKPADKRSLVERSVEDAPSDVRAEADRKALIRQERRDNWQQDQISAGPSATGSTRPRDDIAANRGAEFATSTIGNIPGARAGAKVVTGLAQGLGGIAQAAGDITGIDTLARAGKATAEGAQAFDKGMGKGGDIEGFGPRSPVPYLAEQAEGAASSLGQSAVLAAGVGAKSVIATQAALQGGQSYNEARQAGMSPAAALARAVPQGAFEAIGEKFTGLDRVAGAMGTLLQKGAGDAAKRTAADVLVKAGIREIPGEVLTYLGQTGTDLIPGIGLNQNLTMSQFLDGLRDTVIQSAMMGGAVGAGGMAAGGRVRAPQPIAAQGLGGAQATTPAAPAAEAAVGPDSASPAPVSPAAQAAPVPTAEPPADTAAQIAAIRNPESGKTAALITPNTSPNGIDLTGLHVVPTKMGTFVTNDIEQAREVAMLGDTITDDQMGLALGYTTPKSETDGTVVQALDAQGNVVHEEATNAENLSTAATRALGMAPEDGSVIQTDAIAAQQSRQERAPGPLGRAALAAGSITPEGRPTAMNDPYARPKTFAEQQEAQKSVAALEAEQDAQAEFEAAMLADEVLPDLPDTESPTPKGAQDAQTKPAAAPRSKALVNEVAAPSAPSNSTPAPTPAPAPAVAPAQPKAPRSDSALAEGADAVPPERVRGVADAPATTRAADRAEPAADAPSEGSRGTYESLAAATAYIRQQRARGSNVAAAAFINDDGEIVIATKGTPEYERALDQRQERLKKDKTDDGKNRESRPVAGARKGGRGTDADGGVAAPRGRTPAAGAPVPARAGGDGVEAGAPRLADGRPDGTLSTESFEANGTKVEMSLTAPGGVKGSVKPDDTNKFRVTSRLTKGSVVAPMRIVGHYDSEADAREAYDAEKARLGGAPAPARTAPEHAGVDGSGPKTEQFTSEALTTARAQVEAAAAEWTAFSTEHANQLEGKNKKRKPKATAPDAVKKRFEEYVRMRDAASDAYNAALKAEKLGVAAGQPKTTTADVIDGRVPMTISTEAFKVVTDEFATLFADPEPSEVVRMADKAQPADMLTPEQAQARIEQWKAHAKAQFDNPKTRRANASKTVLSLFDLTGEWSRPWEEAGYNVLRFDIQSGQDVFDFSVEYFTENYDLSDVYAILAATPCTDFASSGAKHFLKKDAAGQTEQSVKLVSQTAATIEYFRPPVWSLENPVGRIQNLTGLPDPRLSFDPNHFGDPYTKKTMIWGNFNADLPAAPVEPTEGSKMHSQFGGKSIETKNARSETPEGFAYAFFMANNYEDRPADQKLAAEYPEASGAVLEALKAGVTEARIHELMENTYGNYEYEEARTVLAEEVADMRAQATATPLDAAANEAATSAHSEAPAPTTAQKLAGNYQMGHLSGDMTQGVDITIENPKDSVRSGTAPDGTAWSNTMGGHYGYAKRSLAADGDHVDVFVGPAADRAPTVYVIDQVNADGTYDEAKAMFGYMNKAAALKAYRSSYSKGWKVGPVTAMPVAEFKAGLESGRFKQPLDPSLAPAKKPEIAKLRNSAISAQSSAPAEAQPDAATQRAASAAAEKKRRAAGDRARARAWEANPGRAFIAKHGIALDLASEWAPGTAERRAAMVQGFGPIFRKSGMQLDTLAEAAVEEGFLQEADDVAMHALIERAIRGERVVPLYAEGVAEDEMEARIARQRELEQDAFEAVNDPLLSDDFLDRIGDDAIPWDSVAELTGVDQSEIDQIETEQQTQREEGRAEGAAGPLESEPGAAQAPDSGAQGRQGRNGEPSAEAAGLNRPSVQDVVSQQERAAQGERAQAAERRTRAARLDADAQVGDFTLTGSDRAADQNPDQGTMFSATDQTDSPAFKKWFGDSKVVDENGEPRVIYHGTNQDFTRFDASRNGQNTKARSSIAFFATENPAEANEYAEMAGRTQIADATAVEKRVADLQRQIEQAEKRGDWDNAERLYLEMEEADLGAINADPSGQNVVPLYASIKNPMVIDMGNSFDADKVVDAIKAAQDGGFDGLKLENVYDPVGDRRDGFSTTQWVGFKPSQLKSAIGNRGTFSSKSADLRMRTADGTATPVKTKPASTEHEAKARRVLSSLQAGMDAHVSFNAVEPDDSTDAGKMLAAVRLTAKRLFGHDVVFVRFNGPAIFNGAMSSLTPNTVYVRVDSSKPHMAILGHELLHSLRQSNPGLYNAMEARLNQLTNDQTTGFYDALVGKYQALGMRVPHGSKLREELYADIVGDHFLDPKFWDGMAADQRGLFRRVADAVVKFLDRIIAMLDNSNALGTKELLKDAEEARRVVIAGMRAFSEEARSRTGLAPLPTAASLSATSRKPAAATEFTRRSKVKHVVYHATNADFDTFDTTKSDLGAHFGNIVQANKVAATRLFGRPGGMPSVMPVYLDLRSPLRLKDVGTFHADGIAPQLAAKGWMTKAEAKAMVDAIDRDWHLRPKFDKQVRELIESKGYDSVVYKNGHEGDGDSYIAFRANQIKSATGNRGTFDRESDDIRLSAADIPKKSNPALTRAIFGGSMEYMRDQNGKPVKAKEQIEKYKAIDPDERGQMLLRQGHVTADQLKRWKASPLDVFNGAVNNRFRQHFETPGIVWRDDELRSIFKLDDEGVAAYRALRAQADESLARHAVADMLRLAGKDGLAVRDEVLAQPMDVAAITLRDHLLSLADQRRAAPPAPKIMMTDSERTAALERAVKLEADAAAMKEGSPSALAKIDEAKRLRADVSASIQSPGAMTQEGKLLTDRANMVIDILDRANDDMGNGRIPDDMKAEARPNPWESPEPTFADRVIYEMQDGRIDLKRTQEAIEKSGVKVREEFDARLAETLYSGRVAKRTQSFLEDDAKPLLQSMALQGIGQVELGDYLHARAAPERNAQIAKVNPDMPDGGAGSNSTGLLLTTEAAKQYIADIPEERRHKLEALAQRVDVITKGTRALLVAEGLEKADTIAAWEAVYKTYVPMFREDVEFSRITTAKRATGSEKKAVNILANVLLQREAAITRAEKNRVKVALYGLALSNPNPKFWVTIRPEGDRAQMLEDVKSMGIDPVEAEAGMASPPTITSVDPATNLVTEQLNPFFRNLPTAINLKINGENRVLLLNEEDPRALRMADALKGADGLTKFDLAGSLIGKTTRWLAAVNTQYNPVFGIVNFMRDTMGGVIHLGNTELRGSSAQVIGGLPGALRGIGAHLAGNEDAGKWSKLFEQFQQDGGQTGFREMFADGTRRAEAVEKDLKRMAQGPLNGFRLGRNVMSLLSGFNEITENAVRLSAYAAALDKGLSRPAAARLARELTVDFNRKGRATREIGPLYAFFNAAIQGNERTLRALRGPTGKYIIAGGLALGVIQALMLAAAGYEEDEIPEYAKARALVIPLFNKDKSYILIPLPLGLHVIPNTGRAITEMVIGNRKNLGKKTIDAIGEISGAFNPLGGGNIFTMDGALRTIMPTVIDPLIELGFNKNFAGTPIEREGRGETDIRPGHQRARERTQRTTTGQAYLGISKAINGMTGGTDYEAGAVSPTPERLRYLGQVALGGVLRETEKIIDTSVAAVRGEKVSPAGVPVAGRFFGKVDSDRVEQSRYFDASKRINKVEAAEKAARKAGDGERVDAIHNDPLYQFIRPANRVDAAVRKLNKLAVQVVGNKEEQEAIDKARVDTMRELNEGIRDMEATRRGPTIADRLKVTK